MRIRSVCIAVAAAVICIMTAIHVMGRGTEEKACREFLAKYGWQTEENVNNSADVKIPAEFDEVYNNYNIIQNEAGLDLTPFCGKSGTRYTFVVKNYPTDVGETVYANVICIGGKPVAGDIMTVSANGFMHSLIMPLD